MRSVETGGNTFYNGDCRTGAGRFLEPASVDLIITDPPYGINGDQLHRHYNRDEEFVIDGYIEVSRDEYATFSREWILQAERILRPGGSMYIVSGYTNLVHILNALQATSLSEVNHIIWKFNFGVFTRRKFVSSHYHILYYEKPGGMRTFNLESRFGTGERGEGGGSLNYRDREDVWVINREYKPGQVKNKNELPSALITKMVQYSSNEGDLVCDLFLGGFSTAVVAIGLNRRVTGFERSGQVFDAGIEKVRQTRQGCLLPAVRVPVTDMVQNRGKPWTDDACNALYSDYTRLVQQAVPKKDIIIQLGKKYGRGWWAIEKALKKRGLAQMPDPNGPVPGGRDHRRATRPDPEHKE